MKFAKVNSVKKYELYQKLLVIFMNFYSLFNIYTMSKTRESSYR